MRFFSNAAALGILLFMAACVDAGFAIANAPAAFGGHAAHMRTLAYGPEKEHRLDLYVPKAQTSAQRPVLVFFYGGGWKEGAKEDYHFVAQAFAEKGYIVAIPDYRKYPQVIFPAFVEDGARALAWVHDEVERHGGSKTHIFLAGHSAGAHLAALLAADECYLAAHGKEARQVVRAFAGLAGPYAFTPDEPDYVAIFGPPARYPLMQVPNFIDGGEPPMLLMYGSKDTLVGRFNLDRLQAKIREKRGGVRSIIYPGLGHIGIIAALTWLNPGGARVLDDMLAFFEQN